MYFTRRHQGARFRIGLSETLRPRDSAVKITPVPTHIMMLVEMLLSRKIEFEKCSVAIYPPNTFENYFVNTMRFVSAIFPSVINR